MLHFSADEFARRRAALTLQMEANGLDAMLLFAQESMYWLTGYDTFGFVFFQCLVVKADGDMALLTRSADLRQARHTSTIDNIVIWRDSANANPAKDLRELMNTMGLLGSTVGIETETVGLTAANGKRVADTLGSFANLKEASDIIPRLRTVKSDEEIVHVRKAAHFADLALDAALTTTKAGADEATILTAMQAAALSEGGDYPANPFVLGSGADALLCRYKSGRRTLDANDQLTIEWAGVAAQYHVPMMHTLVVGTPRAEHHTLFEASHAALTAVESAMRPGQTFGDVFAAHAKAMDDLGMSRHRLNACGYSVGARYAPCWMDGPMFYANNPAPIEPNMTLFAHMIIMDSDSETAMCLGQTYLTTELAPEPLSRHAMQFITL